MSDAQNIPEDAPFDGPWEVITDQWGNGTEKQPAHYKGDLLMRRDTPYDCDWAERVGSLRRVPELQLRRSERFEPAPAAPSAKQTSAARQGSAQANT